MHYGIDLAYIFYVCKKLSTDVYCMYILYISISQFLFGNHIQKMSQELCTIKYTVRGWEVDEGISGLHSILHIKKIQVIHVFNGRVVSFIVLMPFITGP